MSYRMAIVIFLMFFGILLGPLLMKGAAAGDLAESREGVAEDLPPLPPLPAFYKGSGVLKYFIGPEDVLEISVWKNEDLSRVTTVRPDGMIALPLIGDVQAAGLTPEELRKAIVNKLKEYQETVVVSVIVQEVNSFKVFIMGEVAAPGTYTLKRNTTILQAIAMAGGFTEYASRNDIVLIRERSGGSEEEEKIDIRFKDIIHKQHKNLLLRPGDTIFVP